VVGAAYQQRSGGELLVSIPADLGEIARLPRLIGDFGARHGWPTKLVGSINLVLEEVVANTISYGYDAGGRSGAEGIIQIRLSWDGDMVTLEVEDDGVPFDPTQRAAPDTNAVLEERAPGGLGIHFVRTLMDTVEYRRAGDRNRLTMTKHIER
jgi:serine/threonine-protein kinase RsbW